MIRTLYLRLNLLLICLILLNIYSYGIENDSLKCNISVVREVYQNQDNVSKKLMLEFLKTFGKDCKNNVEFSEFSNETLYKVIQKNSDVFSKTLEDNLNQIDFNEIIFNLKNPLNDLIDLDLTIIKIADTKIDKSIKDKLIIAINSGNWEESKNVENVSEKIVMFFLPDSVQFNAILNSDKSEGIYEVSGDFEYYAGKIIDSYKDSTLNVTYSTKRFFIVNNDVIDKMRQESPFGILLLNDNKYKIKTGVYTDLGIQQIINEFFK
ncbi:hypothetical protein [uncultured Draconibacterium sp.]|uniref:hypothetical protein n=1 Tax=uncultured Draconibacterium sp. TaxID=1573823 RepID=UPI0029C8B06C|nr:hypothetical protein [uncultured Draconibacterium sp.]